MFDRKIKQGNQIHRTLKLLGSTFMIVGSVLLLIGLVLALRGAMFLSKAETTTATLSSYINGVEDGTGYSLYYNYEIKGKEFKNIPLNYHSSADYEGKRVTVYYDPQNPTRVKPGWAIFFGCFFTVPIGLVFFIIGLSFLLSIRAKEKRKQRLIESGQLIYARYLGTNRNTNIQVNSRHPFYIECSYNNPYDGNTYLFRSESLWFNPEHLIQDSEIAVYIDRDNYKKYYVDVRQYTEYVVDYR